MTEEWRPVPGWEGRYEVSDQGRIFSCRRRLIMKPTPAPSGHYAVNFQRGDEVKRYTIHSLVLRAFIGPRPVGMTHIRHLDGNPVNNALSNLCYGTASENNLDQVRHGVHANARKTHCPSGHRYTEGNIEVRPSRPNVRYCRSCNVERRKAS